MNAGINLDFDFQWDKFLGSFGSCRPFINHCIRKYFPKVSEEY